MGGKLPSATRIHVKCTPPPGLSRLTGGMPAYQRSEGGAGVLRRAAGKRSVFLYNLSLSSVTSWLPWDSGKFTRVLQPILGSHGCWPLSNPLGTAIFSLVLPGQTISSRKRAQLRSLGK